MNGWPDETGMTLVDRLRRGAQSAQLSEQAAAEIEQLQAAVRSMWIGTEF